MTPAPPGRHQEALEILTSGYQQALAVDLQETPEPEAAQPVPVLGFSKERLDPDLPFAHRLPVNLGGVVAADLLQVVSREGPVHDAALVAGRALGLDGARVTSRRVGPIDDLFLGVLGFAAWQGLALWAAVQVSRGVVAELTLAEKGRPLIEIGQGEERPDAGVLEGDNVLGRAVGRVP